jgi:hypothetical protein
MWELVAAVGAYRVLYRRKVTRMIDGKQITYYVRPMWNVRENMFRPMSSGRMTAKEFAGRTNAPRVSDGNDNWLSDVCARPFETDVLKYKAL